MDFFSRLVDFFSNLSEKSTNEDSKDFIRNDKLSMVSISVFKVTSPKSPNDISLTWLLRIVQSSKTVGDFETMRSRCVDKLEIVFEASVDISGFTSNEFPTPINQSDAFEVQ